MGRTKINSYMKTCRVCGTIYRTTHKKSRKCPECYSCKTPTDKKYWYYLIESEKQSKQRFHNEI